MYRLKKILTLAPIALTFPVLSAFTLQSISVYSGLIPMLLILLLVFIIILILTI